MQSEAASGVAYLLSATRPHNPRLVVNDLPKSTSATMALVARHVHESCLHKHAGPSGGPPPHVVVTNWHHMPRVRHLLRRQWRRLYPNTPWNRAAPFIRFHKVGGTLGPSWKIRGLKTLVWWPWTVLVRESLATAKAVLDPFDEKYNQQRQSDKIF